jgi:hypothetical protein
MHSTDIVLPSFQARPGRLSAFFAIFLGVSLSLLVALALGFDELWHWSTLTSLLCVTLAAAGFQRALNHSTSLFDPAVWLEGYSIYFFGITPLLHVVLDSYIGFPIRPADFRPWLGAMGIVNAFSLVVHFAVMTPVFTARRNGHGAVTPAPVDTVAMSNRTRFWLLVSAGTFAMVLVLVGGPAGFWQQSESRLGGFQGLGPLVLLADNLPLALLLFFAVNRDKFSLSRTRFLLILLVIMQFAVSGLRGSRVQVVFFGLLAVGILYGAGLRLKKGFLLAGLCGALAFSYLYTAYKDAGESALRGEGGAQTRDFSVLLLGDLGRADVQSLVFWHIDQDPHTDLAFGKTYVSAVLAHVPFVPRPVGWGKADFGTQMLIGQIPGDFRVGNIYGASGEAMLNFGLLAGPIALLLRSFASMKALMWFDRAERMGRPTWLVATAMTVLLTTILMSDSDQIIYMFLRFGLLPFSVFAVSSRRSNGSFRSDLRKQPEWSTF